MNDVFSYLIFMDLRRHGGLHCYYLFLIYLFLNNSVGITRVTYSVRSRQSKWKNESLFQEDGILSTANSLFPQLSRNECFLANSSRGYFSNLNNCSTRYNREAQHRGLEFFSSKARCSTRWRSPFRALSEDDLPIIARSGSKGPNGKFGIRELSRVAPASHGCCRSPGVNRQSESTRTSRYPHVPFFPLPFFVFVSFFLHFRRADRE